MITVAVPTRSDLRIEQLIDSLVAAGLEKYKNKIQVVIALNDPTKEIVDLVKILTGKYPGAVKSEFTKKGGISNAKNLVIKKYHKSTEYFLFLDSDCTVANDYLVILSELVKNDEFDMIRGFTDFQPISGSYLSELNCRLRTASYKYNPKVFLSPNLILRKSIFEKSGIFNPKIRYGDDLEFGQRARGLKLKTFYSTKLLAYHQDDPSFWGKTFKTWLGYGKDRGFRLARNFRFNRYPVLQKIAISLGIQRYWETPRLDDLLFSTLYIIISRISSIKYLIANRNSPKEEFAQYPTIEGVGTLQNITKGHELP